MSGIDMNEEMAAERRVPLQTILARPGLVVKEEYKVLEKICEGAFGVVCKAFNIPDGKEVVLKFEKEAKVPPHLSQLHLEKMVYRKLSYRCCPGTRFMTGQGGVFEGHRFLVLDLLGPSLGTLFVTSPERFSVKNVMLLGYELVTQLERLHSVGFIHRDIKPENICVGPGSKSDQIHLIDFGMAKRYAYIQGNHRRVFLPDGQSTGFYGNLMFCSVNALHKKVQSRRDDLEALAYLLVFFLKGTLPWEFADSLVKAKLDTCDKKMCKDLPKEIYSFLRYVKKLSFEKDPDYDWIRRLFLFAILRDCPTLNEENFKIDLVPQPFSSNGNAAVPSKKGTKRKRTSRATD